MLKTREEERMKKKKTHRPALVQLRSIIPSRVHINRRFGASEKTMQMFFGFFFASAHQHPEPITCKLMPLFRGKDLSGFRKPLNAGPSGLPRLLRLLSRDEAAGRFTTSASTPRHLAHLFLSLLRLTWRWSTKAKPRKQNGRTRRAALPYERHFFACEFVQFVSLVLFE